MYRKIIDLMDNKGITFYRLSKVTGISLTTIYRWKNADKFNPTFKSMCKIADALDVSLDELRDDRS